VVDGALVLDGELLGTQPVFEKNDHPLVRQKFGLELHGQARGRFENTDSSLERVDAYKVITELWTIGGRANGERIDWDGSHLAERFVEMWGIGGGDEHELFVEGAADSSKRAKGWAAIGVMDAEFVGFVADDTINVGSQGRT
jgi:hypothetical protein